MESGINNYQIGGSVSASNSFYIERDADAQLYEALLNREICYVFNSRQMGKSSLLLHVKQKLQLIGYKCCFVDISRLGTVQVTVEQWFAGLISEIWRVYYPDTMQEMLAWWQQHGDASPPAKLTQLFEKLIEDFPETELALFFDEIDSVLSLPFPADDFFASVRAIYNRRADHPALAKLQFAFFGVALPQDLVSNKQKSPFNIGKPIELLGFNKFQAHKLIPGLAADKLSAELLLERILDWSNGQPFLTQKLCQLVSDNSPPDDSESLPAWLDKLIHDEIIDNWQNKDRPEHLRTIRDRMVKDDANSMFNLEAYGRLLSTGVIHIEKEDYSRFGLTGIVNIHNGVISIRAKLYKEIFNPAWLAEMLQEQRPYNASFSTWHNTQQDAFLLTGEELIAAKEWAKGKHLPEADYKYISASEERERERYQSWNSRLQDEISQRQTAEKKLLRALKELELAKQEAELANTAKSEFIARLGHEVRTPISHLLGLSQLILQSSSNPIVDRYTTQLHHSTEYLLHVVNDLSSISNIEQAKISVRKESFYLEDSLDDALDIVSERIAKRGLTLSLNAAPELQPMCIGDRARVQQLVVNLITNTLRRTNATELRLGFDFNAENSETLQLEVSVSDTDFDAFSLKPLNSDDDSNRSLDFCQQLCASLGGQLLARLTADTSVFHTRLSFPLAQVAAPMLTQRTVIIEKGDYTKDLSTRLRRLNCKVLVSAVDDLPKLLSVQSEIELVLLETHDNEAIHQWKACLPASQFLLIRPLQVEAEITQLAQQSEVIIITLPCTSRRLLTKLNQASLSGHLGASSAFNDTTPERVLVTEDDDILLEIVGQMLNNLQIPYDVARNGEEAIEKLKQSNYPLVFMDIEMPKLNGIDAVRKIRTMEQQQQREATPIFAMTAHAMEDDSDKYKEIGFNGVLTKPFNQSRLANILVKVMPELIN